MIFILLLFTVEAFAIYHNKTRRKSNHYESYEWDKGGDGVHEDYGITKFWWEDFETIVATTVPWWSSMNISSVLSGTNPASLSNVTLEVTLPTERDPLSNITLPSQLLEQLRRNPEYLLQMVEEVTRKVFGIDTPDLRARVYTWMMELIQNSEISTLPSWVLSLPPPPSPPTKNIFDLTSKYTGDPYATLRQGKDHVTPWFLRNMNGKGIPQRIPGFNGPPRFNRPINGPPRLKGALPPEYPVAPPGNRIPPGFNDGVPPEYHHVPPGFKGFGPESNQGVPQGFERLPPGYQGFSPGSKGIASGFPGFSPQRVTPDLRQFAASQEPSIVPAVSRFERIPPDSQGFPPDSPETPPGTRGFSPSSPGIPPDSRGFPPDSQEAPSGFLGSSQGFATGSPRFPPAPLGEPVFPDHSPGFMGRNPDFQGFPPKMNPSRQHLTDPHNPKNPDLDFSQSMGAYGVKGVPQSPRQGPSPQSDPRFQGGLQGNPGVPKSTIKGSPPRWDVRFQGSPQAPNNLGPSGPGVEGNPGPGIDPHVGQFPPGGPQGRQLQETTNPTPTTLTPIPTTLSPPMVLTPIPMTLPPTPPTLTLTIPTPEMTEQSTHDPLYTASPPPATAAGRQLIDPDYYGIETPDEMGLYKDVRPSLAPPDASIIYEGVTWPTTVTMHPLIEDLKKEMASKSVGYFTVFVTKFMELLATMERDDAERIVIGTDEALNELDRQGYVRGMGTPLWPATLKGSQIIRSVPPEVMQSQAGVAFQMLQHKDNALASDMNDIINMLDMVYMREEGGALLASLVDLDEYPANNKTALTIMRNLLSAVLAPYLRLKGTDRMNLLLDKINVAIEDRYGGNFRRRKIHQKAAVDESNEIDKALDSSGIGNSKFRGMARSTSIFSNHKAKINSKESKNSYHKGKTIVYERTKPEVRDKVSRMGNDNLRDNIQRSRSIFSNHKDKIDSTESGNSFIKNKTIANEYNKQKYRDKRLKIANGNFRDDIERSRIRNSMIRAKGDFKESKNSYHHGKTITKEHTKNKDGRTHKFKDKSDRLTVSTFTTTAKIKRNKYDKHSDKKEIESKHKSLEEFWNKKKNKLNKKGLTIETDRDFTFVKHKETEDKKHAKHIIKKHLKTKHHELYENLRNRHRQAKERKRHKKKSKGSYRHGHNYEKLLKTRLQEDAKLDIKEAKTIIKGHENGLKRSTKLTNHQHMVLQKRFSVVDTFNRNISRMDKMNTKSSKQGVRGASEETNIKKSQYITKPVTDSSIQFKGFDEKHELQKKTDNNNKIRNKKGVIKDSASSDDESDLKFMLQDTIRHGDRIFAERRNLETRNRMNINAMSSYSDEEGVLKKNIYKVFGYDERHMR